MGVDYTGNYGIGVKLESLDFEELNLMDINYMDEYIEDLPKPDGIEVEYFEVGDADYTGNENDYYLCIKDPLCDGANSLQDKIDLFVQYLKSNNIKYLGEVDCVGGLRIW